MSDFKSFCEINSEIDTGINELYADAKCLLKCYDFIINKTGWSLDIPIHEWEGVTVEDGRITELDLGNYEGISYIDGFEGVTGLVLPSGLQKLDLAGNLIGSEGLKELCKVLPPGLKILILYGNNIGADGFTELILPPRLQILKLNNNNIGDEGIIVRGNRK